MHLRQRPPPSLSVADMAAADMAAVAAVASTAVAAAFTVVAEEASMVEALAEADFAVEAPV